MGGRYIPLVWQHEPTIYAPARYRRACKHEAFLPDPIRGMEFSLDAHIAGVVSEAENAIRDLNAVARPALAPIARLLEDLCASINDDTLSPRRTYPSSASCWPRSGIATSRG